MDKRKNNGAKKGVYQGQGRKPKAEEISLIKLGTDAIVKEYGSVERYWQFIANQSKTSFPHMKMLQEYVYGKPKEHVTIEGDTVKPSFTLNLNNE